MIFLLLKLKKSKLYQIQFIKLFELKEEELKGIPIMILANKQVKIYLKIFFGHHTFEF